MWKPSVPGYGYFLELPIVNRYVSYLLARRSITGKTA